MVRSPAFECDYHRQAIRFAAADHHGRYPEMETEIGPLFGIHSVPALELDQLGLK
jgi:hypothetical protein